MFFLGVSIWGGGWGQPSKSYSTRNEVVVPTHNTLSCVTDSAMQTFFSIQVFQNITLCKKMSFIKAVAYNIGNKVVIINYILK